MKELFNVEEMEARYTAFMVECERIRHRLDVMEEELDRQDAAAINGPKGFVWNLLNKGATQ